jgi:hypothetical protein
MEKCPKCKDFTLSFDPKKSMAACNSFSCNYSKGVNNINGYFKSFVVSKLNWDNYCAQTPLFVRQIRESLSNGLGKK